MEKRGTAKLCTICTSTVSLLVVEKVESLVAAGVLHNSCGGTAHGAGGIGNDEVRGWGAGEGGVDALTVGRVAVLSLEGSGGVGEWRVNSRNIGFGGIAAGRWRHHRRCVLVEWVLVRSQINTGRCAV